MCMWKVSGIQEGRAFCRFFKRKCLIDMYYLYWHLNKNIRQIVWEMVSHFFSYTICRYVVQCTYSQLSLKWPVKRMNRLAITRSVSAFVSVSLYIAYFRLYTNTVFINVNWWLCYDYRNRCYLFIEGWRVAEVKLCVMYICLRKLRTNTNFYKKTRPL